MQRVILFLGLVLAAMVAGHAGASTAAEAVHDRQLAQRLGADERGMRPYVLAILKTGPATGLAPEESRRLFEGHFANIQRLSDQGVLVIAGPLGTNPRQYRGLFILAVSTQDEAERLVSTDPAVAAGVFVVEYYPWYGSAALMEAPAIHRRLQPPPPAQ
jgi:uncharacterized protein YciI